MTSGTLVASVLFPSWAAVLILAGLAAACSFLTWVRTVRDWDPWASRIVPRERG